MPRISVAGNEPTQRSGLPQIRESSSTASFNMDDSPNRRSSHSGTQPPGSSGERGPHTNSSNYSSASLGDGEARPLVSGEFGSSELAPRPPVRSSAPTPPPEEESTTRFLRTLEGYGLLRVPVMLEEPVIPGERGLTGISIDFILPDLGSAEEEEEEEEEEEVQNRKEQAPPNGKLLRQQRMIMFVATNLDTADDEGRPFERTPTTPIQGLPQVQMMFPRRRSSNEASSADTTGSFLNNPLSSRATSDSLPHTSPGGQSFEISSVASFACSQNNSTTASSDPGYSAQNSAQPPFESFPLCQQPHTCGSSREGSTNTFFSNVQIPGVRYPGESDKEFKRRLHLEYEEPCIYIRLSKENPPLSFAMHSLSKDPKYSKNLEILVHQWNRRLLDEASYQVQQELPSTQDRKNHFIPKPEDLKIYKGSQIPEVTIATMPGENPCLTDRYGEGIFTFKGKSIPWVGLFGVRDNATAATFSADNLAYFVRQRLTLELEGSSCLLSSIWGALTRATVDLSHSYKNMETGRAEEGGSTLNAALMIDKRLWTMNVGGPRSFLVDPKGVCIPLSVDAKHTRAIGYHDIRGISARADVSFVDCPPGGWEGWYLVQSSNGIHKKHPTQHSVAIASRDLANEVYVGINAGRSPSQIAEDILAKAHARGSTSNLSLVITPMQALCASTSRS